LFLDDFGTGYSSLTHLTQLPISAVKIDKSFVAGVPSRHRQAAVVSALVALSGELDIEVIAEGVETAGQLQALQQMEWPLRQGFLFDRPAAQPSLIAPSVPSPMLRRRPA
jgi:EAL domain-containing protein (putative c-di-GMP-specific phosphodiesterase class I)